MIFLKIPDAKTIQPILKKQSQLPYTYFEVNETKDSRLIKGFDNDHLKVKIGNGIHDFLLAKSLISNWMMMPDDWTVILPEKTPVLKDNTIVLMAKFIGLWWMNCSRIVYIKDEPRKFAFAYGTLPGHMEKGEELFQVMMDEHEVVWYEIKAFSKPRYWLTRLFYPVLRRLQARFRMDSAAQMQGFIRDSVKTGPDRVSKQSQLV